MATYMVEVNNKFMVRIEVEGSALAAEHYFLDNYKGVWGAMAYDQKAMKTDCFIGAMLHDELTSVDSLEEKLKKLEDDDTDLSVLAGRINTYKEEIEKLTKEMNDMNAEYNDLLGHYMKLKKRLNADRPM